jgi:hypothetical protein
MMNPLEGEEKSQLELIFEGYYNFLQRKIIANASDKVGLILYNVVTIILSRNIRKTASTRTTSSRSIVLTARSTLAGSRRLRSFTKISNLDSEGFPIPAFRLTMSFGNMAQR